MKQPRKPRTRVEIYVTDQEMECLRLQAAERNITLSRYARDLLIDAQDAKDDQMRKFQRTLEHFRGDLQLTIAMIDRIAQATTTPEDYAAWQEAVQAALRPSRQN